jgi:hypothetical protein
MNVDNLEKFAKTSLVAEVILDRPGQELKTRPQRNRTRDLSKQQIQTTNSASSSRTQIWLMPILSLIQSCPLRWMQFGSLTT